MNKVRLLRIRGCAYALRDSYVLSVLLLSVLVRALLHAIRNPCVGVAANSLLQISSNAQKQAHRCFSSTVCSITVSKLKLFFRVSQNYRNPDDL